MCVYVGIKDVYRRRDLVEFLGVGWYYWGENKEKEVK